MTKKEIISLSLKLAGIYCLIMSLSNLSFTSVTVISTLRQGFWHMLTSITPFVSLLISITPSILTLLFGAYLILSNKLPTRIASSMIQEDKPTSLTFEDIQVLAFSIIGIWLLSIAIPNLFQIVARINVLFFTNQRLDSGYINSYFIPQIIATVLRLALGIYLFSGGKGLVKRRQKSYGTREMSG